MNNLIRRLQRINATYSLTFNSFMKLMKKRCWILNSIISPKPFPTPGPHSDHSHALVLHHRRTANHPISCLRITSSWASPWVNLITAMVLMLSFPTPSVMLFFPFNLNLRTNWGQIRPFCLLCKYPTKYSILALMLRWKEVWQKC